MILSFIIRVILMFAMFVCFYVGVWPKAYAFSHVLAILIDIVLICFSSWFLSGAFRHPID